MNSKEIKKIIDSADGNDFITIIQKDNKNSIKFKKHSCLIRFDSENTSIILNDKYKPNKKVLTDDSIEDIIISRPI